MIWSIWLPAMMLIKQKEPRTFIFGGWNMWRQSRLIMSKLKMAECPVLSMGGTPEVYKKKKPFIACDCWTDDCHWSQIWSTMFSGSLFWTPLASLRLLRCISILRLLSHLSPAESPWCRNHLGMHLGMLPLLQSPSPSPLTSLDIVSKVSWHENDVELDVWSWTCCPLLYWPFQRSEEVTTLTSL